MRTYLYDAIFRELRNRKATANRRIDIVRETGVSRHHEDPLKPLGPSQHYRIEGLKGGP